MKFIYRLVYALLWPFIKLRNPIAVLGRENIPDGPAIICANHQSLMDPLLIANAFGWKHCLHFITKVEIMKLPFVGSVLKSAGMICVRRGERDMSTIKSALHYLKHGEMVAIFPEGTRVEEGESVDAKTGAAMLALRADVPVVPICMDNPKRRPFKKIRLIIGEPFRLMQRTLSKSEAYKLGADEILTRITNLREAVQPYGAGTNIRTRHGHIWPDILRKGVVIIMKVTIARTAGFCFGVNRALKLAYDAAENGVNAVTLGPLIHNKSVTEDLERRGINQITQLDELEPNQTVIIRSHGVGRSVYARLNDLGAPCIDATCPFVLRIHEIVAKEHREGRTVFVIGAKDHPEIIGISDGYENVLVFEEPEEVERWISGDPGRGDHPISVVFQTTQTQKIKRLTTEIIKKLYTNARIFDTICKSTEKRQEEAAALAKTEQAMIVLGDPSSSNSRKLADTCREYCAHVIFAENACEIELDSIASFTTVGVTAGASTPPWIIKEVNEKMNENPIADATPNVADKETVEQAVPEQFEQVQAAPAAEANNAAPQAAETIKEEALDAEDAAQSVEEEESFESMLEKSFKTLYTGEKVSGTVTAITPTEVYVDLGTKHAGYIPMSEISDDPTAKAEDIFKIGDIVEAYTVRVNDIEGTAMLSKKRLDTVKNWDTVEAAYDNKGVVEGVVTEENKGGVVVSVKGIRVFVPASQTGLPKDTPMTELVKTKVRIKITEVNRARRRVIGSIRAVRQEERRLSADKVWSEIEVGKHYKGTVKSLTSYGAFVDIGGVDGMVHVTELSWERIKTPADVVSVGDEIEVYVISYDKEKRKISLGCKDPGDNPWVRFTKTFSVGDVTTVKVVKFMNFGAFAQIIPGVDGLIHISQIADRRIGKPQDVLSEGQEVEVQITEIEEEKHRVSLSIRALLSQKQETERAESDQDAPEIISLF